MNHKMSVGDLFIVLGALVVGLLVGYGVKKSADKELAASARPVPFGLCTASATPFIINIFRDGISTGTTGASDDHVQTFVCVRDKITWHVADSAVSDYHIFFDESPCESPTSFPPMLYAPSATPTADYDCTVYPNAPTGKGGVRVHKYELIIGTGGIPPTIHRYLDPHIIVSGTGN